MGFEKMMYAYADELELLHQINQDLLEFKLRLLDRVLPVCVPTFSSSATSMNTMAYIPKANGRQSRSTSFRCATVADLALIRLAAAAASP